jgi:hypothetical protein
VWSTPPGSPTVVVATASAEQEQQGDNHDDQHDRTSSLSADDWPLFAVGTMNAPIA